MYCKLTLVGPRLVATCLGNCLSLTSSDCLKIKIKDWDIGEANRTRVAPVPWGMKSPFSCRVYHPPAILAASSAVKHGPRRLSRFFLPPREPRSLCQKTILSGPLSSSRLSCGTSLQIDFFFHLLIRIIRCNTLSQNHNLNRKPGHTRSHAHTPLTPAGTFLP